MTTQPPITFENYSISGMGKINVILGKNGCGKSTALKAIDRAVVNGQMPWKRSQYITPERAGSLTFEANVEQTVFNSPNWLRDTRAVNQFGQFKQQTVAQFRTLRLQVYADVETASFENRKPARYFRDYLTLINGLLENIEIRSQSGDAAFKIYDKVEGTEIPAAAISSGESELISLSIEALVFAHSTVSDSKSLMLIDEPDVHLHPDLQVRLVNFLVALTNDFGFDIMISTHSTPILSALSDVPGAAVCLMRARNRELAFEQIDSIYKSLLPVFGAHPLSQVFAELPMMLVEGDDDVRVWQQAIRTSQGALKIYPVECGGVGDMAAYEKRLSNLLASIYDNAVGLSLRDRDDSDPEALNDEPPVVRMRLQCRSAENLILTDEILTQFSLSWDATQAKIIAWSESQDGLDHPKYEFMKAFIDSGSDRKQSDLKQIRNLLIGQILGTSKTWEILVGQTIGRIYTGDIAALDSPDSILAYLGPKPVEHLGLSKPPLVSDAAATTGDESV